VIPQGSAARRFAAAPGRESSASMTAALMVIVVVILVATGTVEVRYQLADLRARFHRRVVDGG